MTEIPGTSDPHGMGISLWQVIIAGGMFILGMLGSAIGGTWTLARSREKLNEKIDEAKLELERRINAETDTATQPAFRRLS